MLGLRWLFVYALRSYVVGSCECCVFPPREVCLLDCGCRGLGLCIVDIFGVGVGARGGLCGFLGGLLGVGDEAS